MSIQDSSIKLPPQDLWCHISKLAILEDKPIMLDYWTNSLQKEVVIGVKKDTNEKLLVKNSEEYTSPISKIYKVAGCYIICTENSIYIVSADIQTKIIDN
jgi:hypothetical protein